MSKAEERALEAYPKETRDITGFVVDIGHPQYMRDLYIEGYHQAEKDLKLTWEDVCAILYIEREVLREKSNTDADNEDICKEVLKRFLEQKGDKV